MLVATCPSREELLDFVVGKLSDEAADSLAGHLDSCENCQAELAALSDADDTLVARLRGPLPPDPFLDEPECSRAVARARVITENDASTTNLPRLLGEYQLSAKLGSGGMGTVYKALHTKLGRIVALKVLTRARTHDPAAVARFEREMQAVGQLDHRHIVRAHDAREIDGTPILVMEYLDGLDVGEIVRRAGVPALAGNRPAPAKAGTPAPDIAAHDAAELARQTAVGLQTIHEHGQVHRDIKPSNLMLTTEGEVKILDLGLARLRPDMPPGEEMTATGQGMGTADYMAPEQASDSRAVDIRADIYSLGCTLYKLLTGRAPFSAPNYCTAFDKMTAHVHAAPLPVRGLAPAVPDGLATIVDRMLAKNPADRYATPAEVADALSPYCAGADLAALLKRAASSPPLPPGDGGSRSRLPSGTNSGRRENKNLPSPSGRGAGGGRWKRFAGLLLLLLMAGGLGFALAIILRIHKDGKDTTVELPDGSNTRVSGNGNVDIKLPENAAAAAATETPAGRFRTAAVTRGDLTMTVGATGTIEPEEVVDVAAQVEGPIVKFGDDPRGKTDSNFKGKTVDYNTPVEAGAVLAEIDSTVYKTRRDEAAADLDHAKTDLRSAEIRVALAKTGDAKEPLPLNEASVSAAKAAIVKVQAGLYLAQTNLDRTVVRSPVKGTIVDRRVNIGQNVSPAGGSLFLIAKDIGKLQIWASVNEADIGHIAKGMNVRFTVDSFPGEVFSGKVAQIRLNAAMTQNVVTYTVVVAVDKPDPRLMPYMTANVSFQVEARRNVLYVPNAALRYRPRPEQIVPEARAPRTSRKGAVRPGFLWVMADDGIHLRPVEVECGVITEKFTEVSGAALKEGMEVVTGELVGGAEANPFVPKLFKEAGDSGASEKTHAAAPLPVVRVTQPVVCDVCDYEEYTGQIGGNLHMTVEVPEKGVPVCLFKNGMVVKKGDVLAEIVSKDDWARLEAAGNALNLLATSRSGILGRGGRGGGRGGRGGMDRSDPNAEEQWKSAIAEWNRARGNTKTVKVLAPCSGRTSTSGNLAFLLQIGGDSTRVELDAGTPICQIASSDLMVVTFDVPESAVLKHRRTPDRKPNWEQALPVAFGLNDDKGFPYRGKVLSVPEAINGETHAQRWQAIVPNKDGIFMPGMSVRVRLITSEPHKVMLIPGPVNGEVYVVNGRNILETRKVKLGRRYDGFLSVLEGLNANDWVVQPGEGGRGGGEFGYDVGGTVVPEKITTPPPPSASPPEPPSVKVAHPVAREVTDYQDFTGHIEAAKTAEIRARASGNLDKVCFKPGMAVKKGDVLFEIDPRLYQAELDQAAGAVKQAQIRLNARKLDFDRIQILAKNKAVSQEEIDRAKSQRDEAEAALQTALAALYVAQLRLDYTKITAPFDGRIGRSLLDAGNLVTADKTVLATLASTDPMYAYFDIDERTMLAIQRKEGSDHISPLSLPVSFALSDEQGFPHSGKMDAADSRIDSATGTARWRAVLPNKDGMLAPGMFVRVRLAVSSPRKALVVPERSLRSDQGRKYVFVVNDQNLAERRDVQTGPGPLQDEMRVILKGLTADDWVITSGLQQLKPGTTVTPEKTKTPEKTEMGMGVE